MDLVALCFAEVFVITNMTISYQNPELHKMNLNLCENFKTHKVSSTEHSASIPTFT
jgi:hypothetical protein